VSTDHHQAGTATTTTTTTRPRASPGDRHRPEELARVHAPARDHAEGEPGRRAAAGPAAAGDRPERVTQDCNILCSPYNCVSSALGRAEAPPAARRRGAPKRGPRPGPERRPRRTGRLTCWFGRKPRKTARSRRNSADLVVSALPLRYSAAVATCADATVGRPWMMAGVA
jgi:hypothetical protein